MDFNFHHLVALSSGNQIYPLLLNSFKHCYINLAGQFYIESTVVPEVFRFHKQMVRAFEYKDDRTAVQIMRRMLDHGAEQLIKLKAKKLKGESKEAQRGKKKG